MSQKAPPTLPAVGTLARSVCDYFHKHPTEELDSVDISVKFTTTANRAVEQLAAAVSDGLLNRVTSRRQTEAPVVYMAGPDLERAYEVKDSGAVTQQPTTGKAKRTAPNKHHRAATPFSIDLVRIVADLPIPEDKPKTSPWSELFDQLTLVGQAAVLPRDQLQGARLAIGMRKKAGKPGEFVAKAIDDKTCGVWRLADPVHAGAKKAKGAAA